MMLFRAVLGICDLARGACGLARCYGVGACHPLAATSLSRAE